MKIRLKTLRISLLFLCSLCAFAVTFLPSPRAEAGEIIRSISFKGMRSADPTTLKEAILSREGSTYDSARVGADIGRLYKLGLFQNIEVDREDTESGVILTYSLREKPTIAHVLFKGNHKIKTDKLEEVNQVKPRSVFREEDWVKTIEAIRGLYTEKGYYLAEVRHELVPYDEEDNEFDLVFEVEENQEVKIKRVAFVGNHDFSDRELKGTIKTKEKGLFSFLNKSGKYGKETLEQDVMLLTIHYLTHGYLKAKIGSPQVYLSRDKSELYVTFPVREGDPYTVSEIDIAGDILTTKEEIGKLVHLKKGDIANRRTIEDDIRRISEFYGNRGYAFANVYPAIVPEDEHKTAAIVYQIDKGEKITIENIFIKGNLITRDKVIRRELRVVENSTFSQDDLELSRRKLEQLGFFEEINISTPRGSSDDKVNIVIELKEKETGSFNIGGGFSTAEKFLVNASIQKSNFMGYGISGALSFELSSKRQQLSLNYSQPYFLDTQWILSASAYRTIFQFDDFDRESFGGNLSLGRPFFNFWSFFVGYKIEDINLKDVSSNVPALFDNTLSGVTSSVSFTLSRDTRNNRLFATKGFFISDTFEYAGNGVGGDNDFYKQEFNARYYRPIVWKTVLKGNLALGYVNSLNSDAVPLFERYYLGGVNSLRGYSPRSIGPKVRTTSSITGGDGNFVYGGNKFVMSNIEYELPIYDPAGIRAVVFMDAGNAYGEDENIDFSKLRLDYGAGIRWISPFGPMRFEWGLPINKKEGEDPFVFNFTVGSFF